MVKLGCVGELAFGRERRLEVEAVLAEELQELQSLL